jgi:hypothetical protein
LRRRSVFSHLKTSIYTKIHYLAEVVDFLFSTPPNWVKFRRRERQSSGKTKRGRDQQGLAADQDQLSRAQAGEQCRCVTPYARSQADQQRQRTAKVRTKTYARERVRHR